MPVSGKTMVEICNFIRHKTVKKARELLQGVIDLKIAVPFRIYIKDIPHRKGHIGAGRFPIKAAKETLMLVNSVASNAENKGLKSENLVIAVAIANRGPTVYHGGRKGRQEAKRAHLEIALAEPKKKAEKKEAAKKEAAK